MRGTTPQATGSVMLRGEIWQVDLDPARGNEANKQRPAVIVSNDRANATATRLGRGVVTVVPVTSNVTKIYPFQVFLSGATTGLAVDSKAQAEQIRSIATERLRRRIGRVSPAELAQIDQALRLHLEQQTAAFEWCGIRTDEPAAPELARPANIITMCGIVMA